MLLRPFLGPSRHLHGSIFVTRACTAAHHAHSQQARCAPRSGPTRAHRAVLPPNQPPSSRPTTLAIPAERRQVGRHPAAPGLSARAAKLLDEMHPRPSLCVCKREETTPPPPAACGLCPPTRADGGEGQGEGGGAAAAVVWGSSRAVQNGLFSAPAHIPNISRLIATFCVRKVLWGLLMFVLLLQEISLPIFSLSQLLYQLLSHSCSNLNHIHDSLD
jgi:hypothetical protein